MRGILLPPEPTASEPGGFQHQEGAMMTYRDSATTDRASALHRESGAMLIIALAVLTLLSILAVTFAALMRLERRATTNFSNNMRAEMVASSAESTLISMLRGGLYWNGYTDSRDQYSPWLYLDDRSELGVGGLLPLDRLPPEKASLAAQMGSLQMGELASGYFKAKVLDTSGQININGQQDSLAEMLDNLGSAIQKSEKYDHNPLFTGPKETGRQVRGADIITYRNTLDGKRFRTKAELKKFIGEANYELIADFITTQSWVDDSTYRPTDAVPRFNIDPNRAVQQNNVLDPFVGANSDITGAARLTPEPRSPININTASEPVLIAALTGLGGRRAFPLSLIQGKPVDADVGGLVDTEEDDGPRPGQEETTLKPVPVWIYTQPLSIENARRIAREIISTRKRTPFKVWRSGSKSEPGFEEFINALPDSLFPSPNTIAIANPLGKDGDTGTTIRQKLVTGGGGANDPYALAREYFRRGHSKLFARREAGLVAVGRDAWYHDTMRAVLKANFNPNSRINKYNPNANAYMPVDKANLVKLEPHDDRKGQTVAGHTTEFCFDSNGIYEIISIADVATPNTDTGGPGERVARTRRRTIVQVFDVVRHTTQRDFERPFSGLYTSVAEREFVSTYPDPMLALHPDIFQGSLQDGRVEVAGYADALRDQVQPEQRDQLLKSVANNRLAHGFRYRDPRSLGRLKRATRDGSFGPGQNKAELRLVLDPEYARAGGNFRKRYSWDIDAADDSENLQDPIIDTLESGGDLFPDGLNTSWKRRGALGTPFLRFPACQVRANPLDQGAMGRSYRDDVGNLPYYKGGISFWIKLEEDGAAPVFCGLFGATQVQSIVGPDLIANSEGSQMYVWKNTRGQLIVSRLYYHQAFDIGQDVALPIFPEELDADQEEEIHDPKKSQARVDIVVDVSDWKAHEWHHLAIEYNDQAPKYSEIQVLKDFERLTGQRTTPRGGRDHVVLNVEAPKDRMFVGGFYRDQAVAGSGLFKFGTNFATDGRPGNQSIKRVQANATIDEFTTFTGIHQSRFGNIGYFYERPGKYTNRFEIPFPEGIQRVRLRSLAWTMYPPKLYHDLPVDFTSSNFQMSVANVEGNRAFTPIRDAGGDALQNATLAGRWLQGRTSTTGGPALTGELYYQARMRAVRGTGSLYGGRYVATPVLDDVTLTYFLPSARVLLRETLR
ncbi:MAG: hypothetical protein AAF581_16640 [Planctomycetota bacterium]